MMVLSSTCCAYQYISVHRHSIPGAVRCTDKFIRVADLQATIKAVVERVLGGLLESFRGFRADGLGAVGAGRSFSSDVTTWVLPPARRVGGGRTGLSGKYR